MASPGDPPPNLNHADYRQENRRAEREDPLTFHRTTSGVKLFPVSIYVPPPKPSPRLRVRFGSSPPAPFPALSPLPWPRSPWPSCLCPECPECPDRQSPRSALRLRPPQRVRPLGPSPWHGARAAGSSGRDGSDPTPASRNGWEAGTRNCARWAGFRRPFERHAIPGVRADLLALTQRLPHVQQDRQDRKRQDKRADGREHVEEAPASIGRVGRTWRCMPRSPRSCWGKNEVEPDEHEHKRDLLPVARRAFCR